MKNNKQITKREFKVNDVVSYVDRKNETTDDFYYQEFIGKKGKVILKWRTTLDYLVEVDFGGVVLTLGEEDLELAQ